MICNLFRCRSNLNLPYITIVIGLMLLGTHGLCQNNYIVIWGAGVPELLHTGIRYQFTQTQLGLSAGFIPENNRSNYAISADILSHFGGSTELSERRPWFVRGGLNYYYFESTSIISQEIYFNSRIGREMNISRKFGIALDGGVFFKLAGFEDKKSAYDNGLKLGIDLPVGPALSMVLFYRL